jgi:CHASE1-domain containing sensor protein
MLLGGIALFNSTDKVTRSEWEIFNKQQDIDKQLPGILGVGFSLLIPPENLNLHIQQVRNEGFPKYYVKPSNNRKVYTSIVYLEPFKGRNLRAFGYDMFSEKVRRAAMEQARDTGDAALSGKVTLLQETNKGIQAGTLMYFSLYTKGMPTKTIKERREAIYGWVYSPYRMDDLISGILGTKLIEQNPTIELKIFDGQNTLEKNLLYQEPTISKVSSYSGVSLTEHLIINFNGQHWTLVFLQKTSSFFSKIYIVPWIILIGGTLITLMFFMLILSLLRTSVKAHKIAKTLTCDLQASELRWKFAIEGNSDGLWDWNLITNKVFFSDQWKKMLGFTTEEIVANIKEWKKRVHYLLGRLFTGTSTLELKD